MKTSFFNRHRISLALMFLAFAAGLNAQTINQSFVFTGSVQTFVVPPCVSTITVDVKGSQGGSNPMGVVGGLGGSANGVLSVVAGDVLYMYVGGMNGYNGGGLAGPSPCTLAIGGVGGGASDIRLNGTALLNRVAVGGGGGGAGGDRANTCGRGTGGGGGGGWYGGGGGSGYPSASLVVPTGGTQTTGGLGGTSSFSAGQNGTNGSFGIGGNGGLETSSNQAGANTALAGGAGGGLSGANGQQPALNIFTGQSGAGGSSYLGSMTNTSTTTGNRAGNGLITISYNFNGTGVTASASSASICAGSSVTLNAANVVTYTWSPGGSNANSIVVAPSANTSYTAQGTNSLGCVSNVIITVTVDPGLPVISATANPQAVCLNKPATLTASGATTYTWTGGVTNGLSFIPSSTSGYTVTGANACGTTTASVTVTVNPLPGVTASINNPTVCSGNTIILNGGGSVSGYTWTGGATNNVAFVPAGTTNYTVTGAAANGCTNTAVVGVTVLITPTITPIATPTAICLGATATLSAVGATGYTWSPGSNPNTFSVAVSPSGPTIYTVTRSNGLCVSNSTVFLQVNAVPNMVAGASPNQICAGTGVNLNVFGAITYTWLPGGFTSANFTVFPNFSTCYTVTGSNGSCTAVSAVCVTVNPSPSISILTPTTTICQGASITLTTTGSTSFTWSPSSNVNNSTELVTPLTTTIISVTGSNAFGCTANASQLIVVNPLPNASITSNPAFICANQNAVIGVPTSPNTIYSWSNGGNTPSITVNPPVTTNYVFNGTNTLTGCTTSANYSLAVFISTFVVSSPTAICSGQVATLTASGPATSYSWNVNGGIVAPSVTVSPLINTTYQVTGITGSCSNATTVPIVVNPLPNVTAVTDKPTICRFETATITGGGASTYSWSNASTSQVLTFTLSITSNYTLVGTDNNGCSKTATVTQFVAICAGIDGLAEANRAVSIYPNPNNGQFSISSDVEMNLSIVNALGQVVDTIRLSANNNKQASITGLSNGIYFITGESNGIKLNKKIIVEK